MSTNATNVQGKVMTKADFRKELQKVMPGYKWTVHNYTERGHLLATGIRSSGFNRLSTLEVSRRDNDYGCGPWYQVQSSGFGKRAPWAGKAADRTLRRALRELQELYQNRSAKYSSLAMSIQAGREEERNSAPQFTMCSFCFHGPGPCNRVGAGCFVRREPAQSSPAAGE